MTHPDDTYALYLQSGDLDHWRQLIADERPLPCDYFCGRCQRIQQAVALAEHFASEKESVK